jgi:hypothetical protein
MTASCRSLPVSDVRNIFITVCEQLCICGHNFNCTILELMLGSHPSSYFGLVIDLKRVVLISLLIR